MPGGNERLALQENVGSSPFFLSLLLRLLRTPFPIHLHQKDPSSYSSDVLKYMQEEGDDDDYGPRPIDQNKSSQKG